MSRKSLSKKEPAIWYLCNSCKCNVFAKDREQHSCTEQESDESKQQNSTFVKNKKLFTNQFAEKSVTDDLKGINANKVNNLIFLHESIFPLCDLVLGDYVLVSSSALAKNTSIVRSAWPMSTANQGIVCVSQEELRTTWKSTLDLRITIEKLSNDLIPASQISLQPEDAETIDENVWPDIKRVLSIQMRGNIYCVNNEISVNFFNKPFKFIVKELKSNPSSDELQSLVDQFQSMQINAEKCFLVTSSTALELHQSTRVEDEDSKATTRPKIDQIGGMTEVLTQLKDCMNIALGNTTSGSSFYVPRSVILSGQNGSGKTLLCDAVIEQSDAQIIRVTASEIFSKYFGESESKLVGYFEKAYKNHPNPTIIVIEEVSSISPKETKEESSKRVQMAFLNILDEIHIRKDASRLFLVTTTSNVDNVNLAVRRYGRLDVEIEIPVPDPITREQILLKQLKFVKHTLNEEDVKNIANNSHGFIASDLSNLVAKSAMHAARKNTSGEPLIELNDIQFAYCQVVPSAMKEVVIKCPNVKWSDIGGQDELKLQLKQAIEWPLLHPETFTRLGIQPPRGVLMFGPPGCSKTMIAKALATESNVNFISIKGPELFSMWVGESERAVRDLFHKARQVAPSIIFFDEIDAIGGERSASASGSSVKERVLTQLLTEMDGVNALINVTIVAATNRPDLIDKAIMRPGRLDRIVYVRLPDAKTRQEIFRIKLSKMPLGDDVSIGSLVAQSEGYSGAEIQAICQEAAMYALEDNLNVETIAWKYFDKALTNVKPRTSPELLKLYDDYSNESLKV
ncbi:ribosome biogenesis protein SPATA5 [Sitodiplosis mosellana]|uniref:ribosome biogenesis protein SPATA5 n=1 Tax=Sitodiplosis mosellana TaxID=263140 RepID=UPI002444A88B|nr:ribosome biogenesis protein SPATA5 [Sitodiplosis mosellana]